MTATAQTRTTTTRADRTRPVGVDELRRAWRAVQDGQFRARPDRGRPSRGAAATTPARWAPAETVLPVLGAAGQAGASTLAVAIATVAASAGAPARVLECATATVSGLASAATAEHGPTANGWTLGRREQVWIARTGQALTGPGDVPVPDDPPARLGLTVLDVAWETGQVLAGDGWVRDHVLAAATVVVVTSPTVPGLRRLETTLTLLDPARVLVAVVGTARRRWPRQLTAAMGPHSTGIDRAGRLASIPTDRRLARYGLDSTPLPGPLLAAAGQLLRQSAADPHQKGHPA